MISDQPGKLSCSVCNKEIPKSVKEMPEGAEYASHFCSPECECKWKNEGDKPSNTAKIVANPERFYDSPSVVLRESN